MNQSSAALRRSIWIAVYAVRPEKIPNHNGKAAWQGPCWLDRTKIGRTKLRLERTLMPPEVARPP